MERNLLGRDSRVGGLGLAGNDPGPHRLRDGDGSGTGAPTGPGHQQHLILVQTEPGAFPATRAEGVLLPQGSGDGQLGIAPLPEIRTHQPGTRNVRRRISPYHPPTLDFSGFKSGTEEDNTPQGGSGQPKRWEVCYRTAHPKP